jgi:hypothetical protein
MLFVLSLALHTPTSFATDSNKLVTQSLLASASSPDWFKTVTKEDTHRKPVSFDNPDRTIEVGLHVENIHQLSLKDKVRTYALTKMAMSVVRERSV